MSRARVFIASSLDGFIAGPNDELDWLSGHEGVEDTFTPFFQQIGAMLMGRRTFDVVRGFEGEWPYGETPILVATNRPLSTQRESVQGVRGNITELVDQAKQAARDRDVYVDGGALIRSAMDEGLIDELTVTVIPIVLGEGIPLFAGATRRHQLELLGTRAIGAGLVELVYAPRP
ncbi:dihydrofolate reductase family protein [Haliangium sp.]|uniref:dihydrofolate reductase family protein n=1 Tax=Haliangium sp. TaxID=2663208 RepID=UPI003D0A8AD8